MMRVGTGSRGALDAVLAALARRRDLEGRLGAVLRLRGYSEVAVPLLQPPAGDADWAPAYRVLDRDGSLLELRPDVTGPVARLCALGDAGGPRPRRLYYQASIFRQMPGAGPREIAQAGAERIGGAADEAGRVAADAEVLALVAECLEAAGAERFLLALGHSAYVDERLEALGAPLAAARAALQRRDLVALGYLAPSAGPELAWRGSLAEALTDGLVGEGPAAAQWRELLGHLRRLGLESRILVEPGLLLPGGYYSGMVFEVLVPGVPWPVGDGGRYDGLLARWGAAEPAVGFALDTDRLLRALDGEAPGEGTRRAWAAVRAPDRAGGGGRA